MKKILACTLAVCMLLVSLTSCGYDEIELILEEIFDEYLIPLPVESEENIVTKGNKPDEDELDEDETDTGENGTDESDKDETDTNETVPEQCPFEWIAYEEGHYMKMLCNCCAVADFIDPHVDEDYDNSCDVCGYPVKSDECPFEWIAYEEGHYMKMLCNCCAAPEVIDPHENRDADMYCDVCGYYMGPTPTNYFLRNQAGCEWMNEISAEDITEIKIISEAVGVAPGALKTITSSKDKAAITTVFDQYYWLDTSPIPQEEGQIDGGGAVTVKFILNNGTEKVLYFNNGNYLDTHGNYFELLYTPKFSKETAFRSYFGFVNYQEMGVVWEYDDSCEPYDICEIPVDEFEFEYDVDVAFGEIEPYNMEVGTSFGTLIFLTPDVFFIKGVCCMLVGADLDELISEYTEGNDEYSITMNDREWLYEEISPTYKAGDTVSVKINMAMDLGYLFLVNGEEIASCKDVDGLYWEFTFTMPSCDVVIDFKTYDGFLPDINYAVLIEAYWKKNLNAEYVFIIGYYGEFESGAIAAMIEDGRGYDDALWQEKINDVVIQYYNGNRILVLYGDEFYTLTEAYNEGYITSEDLSVIAELHNR